MTNYKETKWIVLMAPDQSLAGLKQLEAEATVSTFKFNGDFDKVSAELKKTFEKQQANFNASLQTLFKPQPSANSAAPTGPHASTGWSSKELRSRVLNSEGSDSARDRLRNSTRSR